MDENGSAARRRSLETGWGKSLERKQERNPTSGELAPADSAPEPAGPVRAADGAGQKRAPLRFTRSELAQLLTLYSGQVMSGEWRDYALDCDAGHAMFSVYRHAYEGPLFTIVKCAPGPNRAGNFMILSGRRRLQAGTSLPALLEVFRRRLAFTAKS